MVDTPSSPRALPRRTQLLLLASATIAALVVLFGLPRLAHLFEPKPAPAPAAPPRGQFIATDQQWATLSFATVQSVGFRGEAQTDGKITTDDDRTTQVFSPYSGHVTHVFARVGDKVKAGQPLFSVQASEFVQGQNDLAAAQAQVRLTRAAEARLHELYKTNGAALKDWQQSQADHAAAEASLSAARNRLKILGISDQQIAALGSRADGAGFIKEAVVRAPISGVVTQRAIGEGQAIASVTNGGSTSAFVVSDLSRVWLVGALREVDATKARVGQALEVRVLALPEQTFAGKVDFVSPTVDPVSRRVAVRAEIANPGGVLKPEMFANFTLATDGATSAVGVPEDAVIYEGDTARVWIAHAGHALELRQISPGQVVGGVVQVLSGLQPGEKVVVGGALFIDRATQGD
ncbi:efflux RND transporter periplasmic adaptor subunit [Phenylobacterium sp.]|jgi:cobalt-zinc-cadmium efflux system membrane fusion protein|uniref:efflux RND transporter periplasmic adaptor subunit n=1 Tax=Phenylobacterium sp. TaxID=1871053 RepID=UPI002F3E94BB